MIALRRRTWSARRRQVGSTSRPGAAQNALQSCVPCNAASAVRIAPRSRRPGTCQAQRSKSGETTVPLSIR